MRTATGERARWMKALEAAFPGKVGNPVRTEDFAQWFALVADNGDVWHRSSAGPELAKLFDRATERLRLGPVPSLRRDEFLQYARRELARGYDSPEELDEDLVEPGTNVPAQSADRTGRGADGNGVEPGVRQPARPEDVSSGEPGAGPPLF